MNSSIKRTKILILLLTVGLNIIHSQEVSLKSLLEEITNREMLSEYPQPAYFCSQFSSYDRASVDPSDNSWFANWDRSMFIRVETKKNSKEYVMVDTKGPGTIVRIWMTFSGEDSGKGVLRIYLDDNELPAIEGNPLDIISGGKLVNEPLSTSVSNKTDYNMRGHNLYLPIPYAERCKITYESDNIIGTGAKGGGEAVYYNINYRTYDKNTQVKTFDLTQLNQLDPELKEVQRQLTTKDLSLPQEFERYTFKEIIPIGKSVDLTISEKNSSIRKIKMRINAPNREQALRSTIIHLLFDNNKTVSCPIGDFFGTGYKINESNTWYTKVESDGTLSCYWIMPYRENCKVVFENLGNQDVQIDHIELITHPYLWTENTMYFCSHWKQYSFLETGEMKNNEGDGFPFDINYIDLKGKGVYVGDCLTLFNTVYAWWGEGDEKIYIDGEFFPSHFGTGTEDYYGYAWCRPEVFTGHPYIGQPEGSGNFNPGYTNNIRFRSLDAIPFRESLRFDMEMWHWTKAIIHFSPVTFWYISPKDVKSNPKPDLSEAILSVAMKREDIVSPNLVNNKIEGENMILEKKTGGNFRYSNNVERGWSNNMQILWSDLTPTDTLSLSFVSDRKRNSDIKIRFSKGIKYGAFRISINQKEYADIDAFAEKDSIGKHTIEDIVFEKGKNIIEIEFVGQQDKNQIGIDCFELSK